MEVCVLSVACVVNAKRLETLSRKHNVFLKYDDETNSDKD